MKDSLVVNSVNSKQSSHSLSQQMMHLSSKRGSLTAEYLPPFSFSSISAASRAPVSRVNLGHVS